jgi:Cellulase (glycosyl hydrolase family 5)
MRATMPGVRRLGVIALLAALTIVGSADAGSVHRAAAFPGAAGGGRPLVTAVFPSASEFSRGALARIRDLGASMVRVNVRWASVAPLVQPQTWDPANPADPSYRWAWLDTRVEAVVAQGLTPYLVAFDAPTWAQASPASHGSASNRPNAAQFGDFAEALARHYSGGYPGVPQVLYYEAWNEPNLSLELVPQLVHDRPVSPGAYRALLNAFADAVHGVDPANVVIAGGLAPFRDITPSVLAQRNDWGPLTFMRSLLCLSKKLHRTCKARVSFDVWSMHPYTSGGPTHHAAFPDDVSLGDLSKVTKVLRAARAQHVISAPRGVGFWVTEFSWDSKPPDPNGVPVSYLARWVPEALYTMWKAGVSQVTWFTVVDHPLSSSYIQSGLYFQRGGRFGRIKPYATGFRFPFVAYPRGGGRIFVWGRTPASKPGRVAIEQKVGNRRHLVRTLRANRFGIFMGMVPRHGSGPLQAQLRPGDEASLPFSLTPLPDKFFNPFGLPVQLEPRHPHHKKHGG